MLIQTLQSYGLSEKEAKIYLLILEFGMMPASKVSSKLGINRTSCYDLLAIMKQKQLVIESTRGGVKRYAATSPEFLFDSLKKKYSVFESILPELIGLGQQFGIKPKIKIFEGLESMKTAYMDLLHSKTDILAILGNEIIYQDLDVWFEEFFIKERVKNKVFAKVLVSNTEKNRVYTSGDASNYRETRYLAFDLDFGCEICLYDNNKLLIALYNEKEMMALILENHAVYTTLSALFQTAWVSV